MLLRLLRLPRPSASYTTAGSAGTAAGHAAAVADPVPASARVVVQRARRAAEMGGYRDAYVFIEAYVAAYEAAPLAS